MQNKTGKWKETELNEYMGGIGEKVEGNRQPRRKQ